MWYRASVLILLSALDARIPVCDFGADPASHVLPPAGRIPGQPQAKRPAKPLSIGDAAPPLAIGTWLKGDAVAALEKGKVYVIEFWSPTSAGAAANMPRLAEIQKKYKDNGVVVIGVASKDPRNGLEAVEKAVKERADIIEYTIGWDPDRKVFGAYVEASGSKYLPTSFIIDRTGTVAHIQSGDDRQLDQPLSQIVAGTFDVKKVLADTKALTGQANAGRRSPAREMHMAMNMGDWDGAIAAFDRIPETEQILPGVELFQKLLLEKEYAAASEVGRRVVGVTTVKSPYNAERMNELAWDIVDPAKQVQTKDLDLALEAATKADEFTNGRSAHIIDTVARVYFWKGDLRKAIDLQRKAVAAVRGPDSTEADSLRETLTEYEEALKTTK